MLVPSSILRPHSQWLDSGLHRDGTKVRDLEGISTYGVDVTMVRVNCQPDATTEPGELKE